MKLGILLLVLLMIFACAVSHAPPISNPICSEPEYEDSLICARAHEHGLEAEHIRDFILDANDVSLILEAYSKGELFNILDKIEQYVNDPLLTYTVLFRFITEDVDKATRVASILKRRFSYFQSYEFMRESDRRLVKIAIVRIRESV
jgi:hypothetical protein